MTTIRHFLAEARHDMHGGVQSWRLLILAGAVSFAASIVAQIVT